MSKYEDLKPNQKEEVYTEYDEEFEYWSIFGVDSGFCYDQLPSKEDAEKKVNEMNCVRG